ncbi:PREDICTED: protein CutA, chloroplastic isoform X2 [Nelumbo nucifera]|uniref:Protein CutA, chloroplastic isoform X2 n=1 Tax=Nelumbo nucifera TaxID=4432 RepID=A0A1U8ATB9_NELNU|nr:PREDICTED: protein CutA, chloroplastic isoform X2 [Nelumbo nucifera]
MASALCCRTSSPIFSRSPSSLLRRRLPLVGAFCVLSLGITNLSPALSSSFKTGSRFANQASAKDVPNTGMESVTRVVPSIVVYVTVPNREAGKKLAESIVKEKLAACVNIVPGIESIYEWQGQIHKDNEELLIIKTRESLLEALTEHVKANHEYEVPEVIALPIKGGSLQYLEWLKNNTRN